MPADSYKGSMFNLARAAAEVKALTTSAFLIALQQHATQVSFFEPLVEHLRVRSRASAMAAPEGADPAFVESPGTTERLRSFLNTRSRTFLQV